MPHLPCQTVDRSNLVAASREAFAVGDSTSPTTRVRLNRPHQISIRWQGCYWFHHELRCRRAIHAVRWYAGDDERLIGAEGTIEQKRVETFAAIAHLQIADFLLLVIAPDEPHFVPHFWVEVPGIEPHHVVVGVGFHLAMPTVRAHRGQGIHLCLTRWSREQCREARPLSVVKVVLGLIEL